MFFWSLYSSNNPGEKKCIMHHGFHKNIKLNQLFKIYSTLLPPHISHGFMVWSLSSIFINTKCFSFLEHGMHINRKTAAMCTVMNYRKHVSIYTVTVTVKCSWILFVWTTKQIDWSIKWRPLWSDVIRKKKCIRQHVP